MGNSPNNGCAAGPTPMPCLTPGVIAGGHGNSLHSGGLLRGADTSKPSSFEIDSFIAPNNPYLSGNRESNINHLSELLLQFQQDHALEYLREFGPDGAGLNAHRFCSTMSVALREKVHGLQAIIAELQSENAQYAVLNTKLQHTVNNIAQERSGNLSAAAGTLQQGDEIEKLRELVHYLPTLWDGTYVQEVSVLRGGLLPHGVDPAIVPNLAVSQGTGFPSGGYFSGEFGILFRSFGNLGRCNYQFSKQIYFSTQVAIPPMVREKLESIVQGNVQLLDWLLDDANKTKFLLVAGLFARLINSEVMGEGFIEGLLKVMGEPASKKNDILEGYCNNSADVVLKVSPALTTKAEAIANNLHERYVSLLSRPTDARHLGDSHRALVNYIEHAGRLSIQVAYTGWKNWRFIFMDTGSSFSSTKMVTCDEGSEGLVHAARDDRILDANDSRIRFCVFPMVVKWDTIGSRGWDIIVKASVFV